MSTRVLPSCRQVAILSALFLILLTLNLPVFAAPPQNAGSATSGPRIWLQENQPLPVQHVAVTLSSGQGMQLADPSALAGLGAAQPVSMASADLDADGFDDLVVGYRGAGGGYISIHRGNIDAFAPQSDASFQAIAHGQFPSPFLLEAKTFSIPVNPDFIALGNFSGSGNKDLAVAAKGGSTLYIFANDGKGNFGQAQTVSLGDGASSLAAGEFGGSHMQVLVVGGSHSLAVYVPTSQGLSALASYKLSAPAGNIVFGDFGDGRQSVAFLSGGKVQILASATMQLTTVALPVSVQAFALGSFIFDRNGGSQIALVAPDGSVQIAVRNEFDPRNYSNQEFQAIRQAKRNNQPLPAFYPAKSFAANGWRIVESFAGAASFGAGQAPVVFRTRVSINGADDVMVLNAFSGQLVLISHADVASGGAQTFVPGQVSLRPYTGTPIAALSLRTNVDVRPGVVALHQGEVAPSLINPIPDPTFTVNTTADGVFPGACAANTANECTLREALLESNGDTVVVPAGTYTLTIAKVANDCTGKFGALSMEHTTTIMGAGQNTTIVQAGTVAYNQGTANGVDMVMNVNEDLGTANCPVTSASGSLSNITLENGHNRGTHGNDGDGGCMEFDTGSAGTANLTLTSVTLQNCDTTQGNGAGIAIFNFEVPTGTGKATFSSSIVQGNSAVDSTANVGAGGGGIWVSQDSAMTMTGSQVKNNLATEKNGTGLGIGGGIFTFTNTANSRQTAVHSSTISGNESAGFGGGIWNSVNLVVDQGTVISGNTAGTSGGSAVAGQVGGGLYDNTSHNGCPGACTDTATLTKVTITGNTASQAGGGIYHGNNTGGGSLTMSFSRLAGNTVSAANSCAASPASGGTNLAEDHSVASVTDNWWGTNAASTTINNCSGTVTFDPFIVLTHTASPQTIKINGSSTLTGDMSKDDQGSGTTLSGNLDEIVGLPITFNGAVLGTIPQAQPETLGNPVPTATATFNAGGTSGLGTANATVDQAVVAVDTNLIASATESGTTATITTVGAHGFTTSEFVNITGVSGTGCAGYNGSFFPILSTPTVTTFTYTAPSGLSSCSGGTASTGLVVLEPPSITKSFNPTTVAENTASAVTFSVTNGNVVPIDGSFTDSLPTNLVVSTPNGLVNNCGSNTVTANAGSGSISFSNPSLAAGTCTIQVNVQSAVDNIYSNSVTIDSTEAGNGNTSTASLTVINPPHIAKSFNPTQIPLNGTSSLTFTLTSSNTNLTLNGVAFTDTLPTGLTVASGTSTQCGGTLTTTNPTGISLSGGTLAPGAQCQFSVTVTGAAAGAYTNTTGAVTSTNGGTGNTASANLTVIAPPSIAKSFNPNSIALNATTSLQFTITNPSPNTISLTGVGFTDTLPTGLTVASGTSTVCGGTLTTTAPTGISLSGATIAASGQCQFSVTVTGAAAGGYTNVTGAVTSTEGGTGNTATANLTVVAPPSIAKAFNPTQIAQNATTSLTFTITNPAANTVAETGVAFTDTLPTGLTVASGTSTVCGGTLTTTAPTGISLSGATIAVGGTCQFSVTVTGATAGAYTNTTGTVSSTNGGTGNTASANLSVIAPPSIAKSFTPATIAQGTTTSLQFTITNPSPNTIPLTGVGFTDTLPTGLTVASGTSTVCGGTLTTTAPTGISLSGATVAASGTCQFSVTVTGTTAGAYTNTTGAVTSNEGGTGNTASASVTVVAPPSIAKVFNPNSIALNTTTSLQFTITNPNTGNSLSGVAFTDTLPTGLTVASGTATVCGGTLTTTAPTSISLSGATIAASGNCQFSVTVTGAAAGSFTNVTGAVTSTEGGTGNTATTNLTVVAPPSIAKAFNPTTIAVNATTSLTFTITNPAANTVAENGVAFSDTLPTGLTVASGTSTVCGGTLTTTAPTGISLSGATIATGGTCQFSVTVTGTASGQYTNTTGAVSSTNGGTGNTAMANLTVASPPSITKSFGAATIPLNGTTTLSFSISNPNTIGLTGVAFTDNLPAGLVVASTPSLTNTCNGAPTATAGSSTVSLSGGTIAASSSCAVSVNVTGTTAGLKNNSVTVSSTEGGTGNTSTASLTVNQASTSTAVASSLNPSVFGQSITFIATVTNTSAGSTGAPTGSVQFVVDGVNFGSPVALTGASSTTSTATSAAIATLSVAGSPHSVSANYTNADGNFINSSGSLAGGQTVTIASTSTVVVSSANPSVFGQSVTFTATVMDTSAGSTAQPTGSVQFVVDGVNFGSPVTLTGASSNTSTATSQATSTLSISGSPHSVSANYVNADGNFTNSTGSLSGGQVVTQANTTTAVNSSAGTITLGDTVTFTATVTVNPPGTGTPTGLVTFFNGSTPIGTGVLNGSDQATFSTAVLPVGSDSITAIYNGDANFSASPLSSAITETVNLRTSATSVALNPTTVGAGQPSTITVTVTDSGSVPPGAADTFTTTGAPATARTGFTSTLFADGLVLVAGGTGSDGATVLSSAEIYSVSGGAFSSTGNLNTARTGAVAVLLPNGKVLVAGGSSNTSANGALNSAELFDPKAGTFTPASHNMTAARFGATATLLATGKVLIAGGENSGSVLNTAELYDPAADTFTATGNLNTARTGHSATLLGTGKVLVAGGSSNGAATGALSSAEVFDPAGNAGAGSFSTVVGSNPTLAAARWQPEAALLLSGKVLVAGGENNSSGIVVLTTADLYDPVADSFTATAHGMNEARANGSAVALPNGMVLLPGGTTSTTVDLYDADGDRFDTTGALLNSDNGLVATQLNNGQVLVVGLTTAATPASDAELYAPSFNPLGTIGFGSSEATDVFGPACVLAPSTATASTCTSTVTPVMVGTSPHTITGTYPTDAVHSGSSNTASLTVIPAAPPTIAKAFSAANVAQNGTVNVSFTISNPSTTGSLTGIMFPDALPAGLTVATPDNLTNNCGGTVAASGSSISLMNGALGPQPPPPIGPIRKTSGRKAPSTPAAGQCVITLDLLVTGTGKISNTTGPIFANESGFGTASNTATLQVVLGPTTPQAFGKASIPLNGTTSLTFNITNPNPATTLDGIALSDMLPSGLVVATPNGLTGTCTTVSPAPVISATPGSNSISLSALNLAAAASCTLIVNVTGTSAGTKNNTPSLTGTFDDGTGTFRVVTGTVLPGTVSLVVVAPPAISKAFAPPAIAPGGISTLTFTITNPAANTVAETGVAFTDTLPANVVIATPNGLSGACGGTVTATAGTGTITLAGGTIATAGSCAISVNVTSSVIGSYTNTTGAVSSTNGGTGNTASANLTVAHASLSITKTHTGNFPRGSMGNNYTITVSNSATAGPTVGTVMVTDTLPNVQNTLVPTAMSGTGWTCTLATLTCTRSDSLAPGASYPPITLTVTVPQNIQANVTNSATVSGGGDPNSHTANDPTHIGPPIEVTIAINNVTVNVGGTQFVNFTVDSSPGEGTINFACTGLAFGMTCSFNPPSTNQLSTNVTMGITASAGSSQVVPLGPGSGRVPPLYAAVVPLLGLLVGFGLRKKARLVRLRLAFALAGLALLLVFAGCGGNRTTVPPTPQGTFQVTVTATSTVTGDSGSATIAVTVPQ